MDKTLSFTLQNIGCKFQVFMLIFLQTICSEIFQAIIFSQNIIDDLTKHIEISYERFNYTSLERSLMAEGLVVIRYRLTAELYSLTLTAVELHSTFDGHTLSYFFCSNGFGNFEKQSKYLNELLAPVKEQWMGPEIEQYV